MELHSQNLMGTPIWLIFLSLLDRFIFCTSCEVLSNTNAQIERRAFGAGLHRSVETVVWVSSKIPLLSCTVVLQEFLPPGAYVDPEQLASLQRRGVIPPFVVGGPVDVEVGEWTASHSKVVFYPDMVEQTPLASKHGQDTTWLVNFTIPLHVRYHRPRSLSSQGSAEAVVRLPHPGVLLQCQNLDLSEKCLTITVPLPCGAHDAVADSSENDAQYLQDEEEDELYESFDENNECHRDGKNCLGGKDFKVSIPKNAKDLADKNRDCRRGEKNCLRDKDLQTSIPKDVGASSYLSESSKMSDQTTPKEKGLHETKPIPGMLLDNLPPPVFEVPFADAYPSGFSELPTCYWLPLHTFSTSEGLALSVPVGDLDHLELVLFVTTAVTAAAALLLLTPVLRQYRLQLS